MTETKPGPEPDPQDPTLKGKFKKPKPATVQEQAPGEVGGPQGPEPTRYGDWERKGIVSDF